MKLIRNVIINLFWVIPKELVLMYWEVIIDCFEILSKDDKEVKLCASIARNRTRQ